MLSEDAGHVAEVRKTEQPRFGVAEPPLIPSRVGWLVAVTGLYVASRLVVFLGAVIGSFIGPSQDLVDVLSRWDAAWYLSIVDGGYAESVPATSGNDSQVNLAFFPLLLLLGSATSSVLGISSQIAGIIVGIVTGFLATVAVYQLSFHLTERSTALRATALFVFFQELQFLASSIPKASS